MSRENMYRIGPLLVAFWLGFAAGHYHAAGDIAPNMVGASGRLYGWTVIDAGDPYPSTRLVCREPYVDEGKRVIVCSPGGESK